MTLLKKYKKPEMEIALIESDIITSSGMGPAEGGDDGKLFGISNSISKMNPLDRPLGIFKRD